MSIVASFVVLLVWYHIFFFKLKTADELRISDWSSDVCSSDLVLLLSSPAIMKLCPEPSSTVVSADRLLSAGTSELREKSSSDTVGRTRIDMRPSDRTVGVKASCTPYCLNSIVFP